MTKRKRTQARTHTCLSILGGCLAAAIVIPLGLVVLWIAGPYLCAAAVIVVTVMAIAITLTSGLFHQS